MIAEVVVVLVLFAAGAAIAAALGFEGVGLVPWAFMLGTFAYLAIGTVQVVTFAPTYPVITLGLLAGAGVVAAWRGRVSLRTHARPLIAGAGLVVAVAVAVRLLTLVKWTADSLVYVNVGLLLGTNRYHAVPAPQIADERLIGVGLLQAPAVLAHATTIAAVTPLLSLATVGVLAWFIDRGLARRVPPAWVKVGVALAVALAFSANRWVFTTFYINGHVIVAAAVLIIAGVGWLSSAGRSQRGLVVAAVLVIPGTVVTRPDAAVALAVVLVPVVFGPGISRAARVALVGTLGGSMAAWYGFAWAVHAAAATRAPIAVSGSFAAGIVLLAVAPVLLARVWSRWSNLIVVGSEVALWALVVAATLRQPGLIETSVRATARNLLGSGGWAPALPLLAVVLAVALVVYRLPEVRSLRYAVTTFFPLALVFAAVRDGAFRIGPGDSLNRSWAHIYPTAILLLVALVALGQVRRGTRRQSELDSEATLSQPDPPAA